MVAKLHFFEEHFNEKEHAENKKYKMCGSSNKRAIGNEMEVYPHPSQKSD